MLRATNPQSTGATSNLQALLYALSLAGYPLIAIFPTLFNIDTQLITIPYRATVLFLSMLATFFFLRGGAKLFKSKFWIPFSVFWFLYSCRLFYELVLAENMLGFKEQDYVLFTYGITLLPAIVFAFPPSAPTLDRARQLTFIISICALIGTLSVGWETIFLSEFSRFNIEALNPVSFGVLGAVTILISFTNILADPQPTVRNVIFRNLVRSTYFLGIALGLIVIFISGSRGPLIATAISATAILWVALRKNLRSAVFLLPIALIVIVAILMLGSETITSGTLFERLRSISTLEDQSDTDRLALWQGGLSQFLENPITGSGLDEQTFLYYPHNIPLEAFMSTGLLGGVCFSIALFISLRCAFRLLRFPAQYSWVAVIFLALSMTSLLAGSIWGAGSLIHMMLAVMALSGIAKKDKQATSTELQSQRFARVV